MKLPKTPPGLGEFWKNTDLLVKLMSHPTSHLINGKYLHWDKMRFYQPPGDLTHEEWWYAVKFRRMVQYKPLPLKDKSGAPFQFLFADPIPEMLHKIDLGAGGHIGMADQITNPETRDQYYVSSLMDEAITSSQLEGATTTRPIAKEMIRTGRPPRDRSERMILNNFLAMKRIHQLRDKPLTQELVLEIHRIVTDNALDDPTAAGRFRRADEEVRVEGSYGEVYHTPPDASELDSRMDEMCKFANGESPGGFLYPVLRSIVLHFWLSYDHPFKDGNGRTARAIFYWSMLKHGYWLCEFISISQIIRKAPVKYGRAFLYSETDENDLTYFVLYHLEVIQRAIQELHDYITRKTNQLKKIEAELRGIVVLNHRQRALVSHALRHPNARYTIEPHRTSHNVVYETARTDLLDLRDRGLLTGLKVGNTWYFLPVSGIDEKLATLSISP